MKKTILYMVQARALARSLGRKFGTNDFRIVLMARNAESLNVYADEFDAEGIEVNAKTADAANDEGLRTLSAESAGRGKSDRY